MTTDFFCHSERSEESPSACGRCFTDVQHDKTCGKPFKICVNSYHLCAIKHTAKLSFLYAFPGRIKSWMVDYVRRPAEINTLDGWGGGMYLWMEFLYNNVPAHITI